MNVRQNIVRHLDNPLKLGDRQMQNLGVLGVSPLVQNWCVYKEFTSVKQLFTKPSSFDGLQLVKK